ncbi:serine/threonine-protein kinase [Nocardia sp. NPDC006630]|uniref:serine/threonine-protein kinase n=1 Tax=Nocardia sp. NPDC006630 TaxID=3157181 RepID=UPI0033A1F64B
MNIGPGAIVGGYRIERVLGAGGMGTVYLGKHPSLPRWDALKVLSDEMTRDAEFRARFEREANLASGLDHPNIVSVYNRGADHGQLWIAMQFVDGTDASAAMKRHPAGMTPERALRIVTEVGRGLDHAHRRGLLHRDIKPANFLLSAVDGDEERVLLTDFGVAKSMQDTSELTAAGEFVATIAYAAPEQLSGGELSRHTDIYSLACSFYKLLTGRNPYPGTQAALVMTGHLYEPPPRITIVLPELPPALDQVLAIAMAKDPARRFDTCREFTHALELALRYGVSPASAATRPERISAGGNHSNLTPFDAEALKVRVKPGARKKRLIALVAAAAALALVAGIGLWAVRGHDSGRPVSTAAPTATTAAAPGNVAEARQQNPAFLGKIIAAVDITGEGGYEATVAVHLKPSPQAAFFEALGFVYNNTCVRNGNEPTPRVMVKDPAGDPTLLSQLDSGYLLAVRSDTSAGGGGLVNLPLEVTMRHTTVLVLDDPKAIDALRNWTDASEQILLDKLLPVLRKGVK